MDFCRHFDVLHNVKKDMLPRETIASIVHTVKNWLGVTIVSLHLKIYFLIFLLYIRKDIQFCIPHINFLVLFIQDNLLRRVIDIYMKILSWRVASMPPYHSRNHSCRRRKSVENYTITIVSGRRTNL